MRRFAVVLLAPLALACAPGPTPASSGAAATGIDLSPRIADRPVGGNPILVEQVPAVTTTTALENLRTYGAVDGTAISSFGTPSSIWKGSELAILGTSTDAAGVVWLRVYVLPDASGGDLYTWTPSTDHGRPLVGPPQSLGCLGPRGNVTVVASLDPFSRARCEGSATVTLTGRTYLPAFPVVYDVEPSWFGPGPNHPGASFSLRDVAYPEIDLRVPPGLESPPPGITVRVDLHVADPAAETCRRTDSSQLMPAEAPADSRLWCTVQLVVERWTPILGSEGRPFDPQEPQLNRFTDYGTCAGVGSGPMTFHVDPYRLVPVWLEAKGRPDPIEVSFTEGFRFTFEPAPGVVDAAGQLVARDGMVVNGDDALFGHPTCFNGYDLTVS